MDFLKTMLAYMALIATLGVQEGPAPDTVPTPTPLPTYVTATPAPFQTPAPTATADQASAPTARPAPALTPNTRYTKLVFGNSGNSVKKLQNKLIDLGYLPEGAADGKYGYQTYNAVKAFQKANRLAVDGVAGPATLTNLYENPNAVRAVTATPKPTSTSKPTKAPAPSPSPTVTPAVRLTVLNGAYIINGADGRTLSREAVADGVPTLIRPQLWVNEAGAPVMSLAQLADSLDGWTLMGSSADGLYALRACGYNITLRLDADRLTVLVDGQNTPVAAEDAFLLHDTLYVTDAFLRKALGAQTVFDADEKSLVLFLQDKSIADAQD